MYTCTFWFWTRFEHVIYVHMYKHFKRVRSTLLFVFNGYGYPITFDMFYQSKIGETLKIFIRIAKCLKIKWKNKVWLSTHSSHWMDISKKLFMQCFMWSSESHILSCFSSMEIYVEYNGCKQSEGCQVDVTFYSYFKYF